MAPAGGVALPMASCLAPRFYCDSVLLNQMRPAPVKERAAARHRPNSGPGGRTRLGGRVIAEPGTQCQGPFVLSPNRAYSTPRLPPISSSARSGLSGCTCR